MKTISDYLIWLNKLYTKTINEKTKISLEKLITLLNRLDSKKVFENNAYRILKRLEKLFIKVEVRPGRTRYFIDSCIADILTITPKYYKLVGKGYYQREWMSYGISFGLLLGVIIYSISKNPAFIGIGLAIGLSIGLGIGYKLDKKAINENRVLKIK